MSFILRSICFPFDGLVGYVAGEHGIIAKTLDGAAVWNYLDSKTTTNIRCIYFPKGRSDVGWIVGENGLVKITSNGGDNWVDQHLPIPVTGVNLNKIFISDDATIGWIIGDGGKIFKTINGGATWVEQTSGTSANLNAISFPDDVYNGYVVGNSGIILKTVDGGDHWIIHTPSVTSYNLKGVDFPVSSIIGYAVGESNISLKTANAGSTWVSGILQAAPQMNGVDFPTSTIGYKVGLTGVVYKTISEQENVPVWFALNSGTTRDLYDVTFVDDSIGNTGYAVGDELTIIKTIDGATWASASLSANVPFGNFSFVASSGSTTALTVTNTTSLFLNINSVNAVSATVTSDTSVVTYTVTDPVMWVPVTIPHGDGDKYVYVKLTSSSSQNITTFEKIYLDTQAPLPGVIDTPSSTSIADINVKFNAVDEYSTSIWFMLSNVSTFDAGGEVWTLLDVSLYYPWTLSGSINEYKTIYAKFKDDAGNVFSSIYKTIAYGNLAAPPKVGGVMLEVIDNIVTVTWSSVT